MKLLNKVAQLCKSLTIILKLYRRPCHVQQHPPIGARSRSTSIVQCRGAREEKVALMLTVFNTKGYLESGYAAVEV